LILIFATADDPVAADGAASLSRRGAEVVRWDVAGFPAEIRLSMRWDRHGRRTKHAVIGDRALRLDDVDVVWHRRMGAVPAAALTEPRVRRFVEHEATYVLEELVADLCDLGVPFVPAPWPVMQAKQAKLMQLTCAGRLGLEVPATLVTNDPAQLRAFHREHGRLITKHVDPWALENSGLTREYQRFTQPVSRRDLMALASARWCPVFAQAYVPKRIELRVTLVGDRVFAAEIHSQRSARTRHDWRHVDRAATLLPHDLPDDIADKCRRVAGELGLRYGAFDFVVTPDGRYVFLEVNPGGEFHWIEGLTHLPITEAIVELVLELASRTQHARRAA
jgi:glutathione synthase/RimK-type ligase-like ATP-grasp enzyme